MADGGQAKIVTYLVDLIEGVTGVENVFAGEMMTRDLGSFIAQFKASDNTLRGFTVFRRGTKTKPLTTMEHQWDHTIVIRGYRGLSVANGSEATFQQQLDDVVNTVNRDETLGGNCETHNCLQLPQQKPMMYGNVLCHFAEMSLVAQELVTR